MQNDKEPKEHHYFVGIDIGKRKHVVAVMNQTNDILERNKVITVNREGFEKLLRLVKPYQKNGTGSLLADSVSIPS